MGEKKVCNFFIEASQFVLDLLLLELVQASNKLELGLPVRLESLRPYLTRIILPLIETDEREKKQA
jgi:hypothetical protein